MTYYLFRMMTDAHTFEADCACHDDLDATKAAEGWAVDFLSVEVWDGNRRVAFVTKENVPSFLGAG